MKRGLFIVIDGVGGSGKTTQVRLLRKRFGGKFLITHEPGGAPRAEKIRKVLLKGHSEKPTPLMDFFLFWAARVEHVYEKIAPALKKKIHVISDRFDSATYAFQVFGEQRPDLEKLFWEARRVVLKHAEPNHYIVLDLPPEIAQERRITRKPTMDRFDERDMTFQTRVRAGYRAFAKRVGRRATVVDASRSIQHVHDDIARILKRLIA
jgi:dTMP kinase